MSRAGSLAMAALTTSAVCGLAAPALGASPVERLSMSFEEPPESVYVDGLGPGCPAFTGTLTENRHLEIAAWTKPDGSAHARTDVEATVTLQPSDPAAPSYAGRYSQHQTGQFTGFGEDDRVVATTTHGQMTGTDGSTYRISEVVHFTVDGSGTVRARFDRFRCG